MLPLYSRLEITGTPLMRLSGQGAKLYFQLQADIGISAHQRLGFDGQANVFVVE